MPAAAIGAVGSVAGGIASGKGASKAAQIQADAAAKQTAALQAMYNNNVSLATPTMNNGNAAQTQIQSLLGLSGDPTSAEATLAATPGYQFAKQQGLDSINANAYASGQGNSGAALKSALQYTTGLADQNYNNYIGQLGTVADRGVSALNSITNQGNVTTAQENAVTQTGANAAAGNAAYQGNNIASILKGLSQAGTQAYASSYSTPSIQPSVSMSLADPNASPLTSAFNSSGYNTKYF